MSFQFLEQRRTWLIVGTIAFFVVLIGLVILIAPAVPIMIGGLR